MTLQSSMTASLAALTRRVPVLHDDYPYGLLLAAVSAVRSHRFGDGGSPEARLAPLFGVDPPDSRVYEPLASEDIGKIADSISDIIAIAPGWRVVFGLPAQFMYLPESSEAVSASHPQWPQVIFLARATLSSASELREQLIHEFSHQWQYLVEEIRPLEQPGQMRTYTLPSGTKERSPREILGAFHVGATLTRYYRAAGQATQVEALRDYVEGCRSMLQDLQPALTPEGRQLALLIEETVC